MPSSSKRKTFLVVVLILLAGLLYAAGKATAPSAPVSGSPSPVPQTLSVAGVPRCLPPAPDISAATLECAVGIESDRGLFYALDLTGLSDQAISALHVSDRIEVRGTFVTKEALSASYWQRYEMEGVIQVREFVIL